MVVVYNSDSSNIDFPPRVTIVVTLGGKVYVETL